MIVPSVVSGSGSTKLRVWVEWPAHAHCHSERDITHHAGHKGARRAAVMRSVLTLYDAAMQQENKSRMSYEDRLLF